MGKMNKKAYEVFPGVQLTYHSVHMDQLNLNFSKSGNYETVKEYHFPLRHFHGIAISIDVDKIFEENTAVMETFGVYPLKIIENLCGSNKRFNARSEEYVEHIFSELCAVPEDIKQGYVKLKIIELLLVLSEKGQKANETKEQTHLPKFQVQLANQIASYLSENMEQHITMEELAKKYNVSVTHLKNVFKAVYGVPVFSYMRIQKMQLAAQLLIHTDEPIAEIAYKFGYHNISKFSAAFQKIMGDTPSQYRREHRKYHM